MNTDRAEPSQRESVASATVEPVPERDGIEPGRAQPLEVDDATMHLLRRLLTLPEPTVRRARSQVRWARRAGESGPTAEYGDT